MRSTAFVRPLIFIGLLCVATARVAAQQPEITTTGFGEITMWTVAGEWRIEDFPAVSPPIDGIPDGMTLTCQVERCLGAVIDITREERAPYCDGPAALAAAAESFPNLPRHNLEVHGISGFAAFITFSDAGYDPRVGRAGFACINLGGIRFEFRTQLGEEPLPQGHDSIFLELLTGIEPPQPQGTVLTTERLALFLRDDIWDAIDFGGDPERRANIPDGTWYLTCLPPACGDRVDVTLVERDAVEGENAGNCLPPAYVTEYAVPRPAVSVPQEDGDDLEFVMAAMQPNCLVQTAAQFAACTVHDGTLYMLFTAPDDRCRIGPDVSEQLFVDLLQSIQILPAP